MKRSLFLAAIAAMILTSGPRLHAETYKIDTVHSGVTFQIMHNGVNYVPGMFTKFEGTIVFDKDDPAKNELDLTIDTNSIFTGNMKRDQHLKGPDFFNVKQFPTATFKSTSVKQNDDETYSVTGDLTMLGKTNTVTIKAKFIGENSTDSGVVIGGWGEFKLTRSLFGMDYGVGKIGDDVIVKLHVQAMKS
ncbi:MAG: YceI family protein [Verrucomicrobiota bacterium]